MVENGRVFTFHLDAEDWERLDAGQARSRDLFKLIGDCGDEYRRELLGANQNQTRRKPDA